MGLSKIQKKIEKVHDVMLCTANSPLTRKHFTSLFLADTDGKVWSNAAVDHLLQGCAIRDAFCIPLLSYCFLPSWKQPGHSPLTSDISEAF